ncbi:MAG: hypothetical protein H0V43_09005 [Gemmatimonadales bacterium]|nr:hypothetical protein [Gemmatimonadales bacterium]MBA3555364.1 hypothetical protein [Gemmatimonadales bacterium]
MTDRLYYTDAYLREFDATVVDSSDEGRRVYLDRTAFYPTSGPRAVFVGTVAESATVLLAASEDSGVDAGRILKATLERMNGRGGGNARLAQGSAPAEALDQVVEALLGELV